jgi:hypothetical protein
VHGCGGRRVDACGPLPDIGADQHGRDSSSERWPSLRNSIAAALRGVRCPFVRLRLVAPIPSLDGLGKHTEVFVPCRHRFSATAVNQRSPSPYQDSSVAASVLRHSPSASGIRRWKTAKLEHKVTNAVELFAGLPELRSKAAAGLAKEARAVLAAAGYDPAAPSEWTIDISSCALHPRLAAPPSSPPYPASLSRAPREYRAAQFADLKFFLTADHFRR